MAIASKRSPLRLTPAQRQPLEALLRKTTLPAGLARRVRAILLVADGHSISSIGRQVVMQRRHIYKWIDRFREHGLAGLTDEKRTGRPPVFSPRGRDSSGQDRLRTTR